MGLKNCFTNLSGAFLVGRDYDRKACNVRLAYRGSRAAGNPLPQQCLPGSAIEKRADEWRENSVFLAHPQMIYMAANSNVRTVPQEGIGD